MKQKLFTLLTLLLCAATGVWADTSYYTPTADEVIYLKNAYSATATTTGYSTHSAVAWAGTTNSSSKTAGDPDKNGESSTKLDCYSIKNNGGGKNISLSISGVSKIIIYREASNLGRYPQLIMTEDGTTSSTTMSGSGLTGSPYLHEFEIDGTKSYSIALQGWDPNKDDGSKQDIYVYAIKLIKYVARTIDTETLSGVKVGTMTLTKGDMSAGYSVSGSTITLTDVAYVQPTDVTLTNHIVYTDYSTEDKNVAVTFGDTPVNNFWEGTAKIGTTTYTVKVPYEAQSITAVAINGTSISAEDLAKLTSTKAVSIDGSALNGIGTINVTLSGGTTSVRRANSGNDAVFTFTLNGSDNYTVTVTNVKKTYTALGSIVYTQKNGARPDGYNGNIKTLTANGITFTYPSKAFQEGSGTVTLGSDVYKSIKLSTGEATTVTFPEYKKATKVRVYGWSVGGNGKMYAIQETSDASGKKVGDLSNDIYYATNTSEDIYPSVYEYNLDNWESMYFNAGGSPSQPFVVMDFVFADSRSALESFAFSGGNTSVYTDGLSSFVAPTLAATYGGSNVLSELTVTYASSNTDVATVASTGEVTLTGTTGTATITATFSGDATYQEASAAYTIMVLVNPVGNHTLTWTLSPLNSASAELTSSQVSTSSNLTNLGTIDVSLVGFASSPSKASNRTAKINRLAAKDVNKYVYVTFDVADGCTFTPSSVMIKVANVSDVTTFDAELVSTNGVSVSETGKTFSSKDGSVETWTISNSDDSKKMTGTVTLKIYAYSETNDEGSFRFGDAITIAGAVNENVSTTLASSGTSSFSSSKALDFSAVVGLKAYVVANVTSTAVTMTSVDAAPAATGLVLKGTGSTPYSIPVATTTPAAISVNKLVAAVERTNVGASNAWVLNGGEFKLYTGEIVPAGKAYLPASEVPAGARLAMVFDGETTGISSAVSEVLGNGRFYDLQGREVAQPTKGLYIVNGKKVILR